MKKVLICYHSSQFGGVEKHILDLIEGLSNNYEIYVACPEGPLVKAYLKAGAKRHFNLFPKFEADFAYSLKIRSLINNEKIEILHAHELLTGSLATFGGWLAGSQCKRRIYHVHTSFTEWVYGSLKKYPALAINTIVNFIVGNFFATDVIALTESIKRIRVKKELIYIDKIRVIPNGIHIEDFNYDKQGREEIRRKFNIPEDNFVIGNIARFTEEKGHKVLLDAFKKTIELHTENNFSLILAGSGILQNQIREKVAEYDLQNDVHFLGNFQESDKNKILSAFDCFVFPSLAEGFGIALVEAMAIGIPVIASDLDVLQDVGGNTIFYFKVGNSEDLKNKILELMELNNTKNLQSKEKERAKDFSMQNFWQAYSNLYNS